MDVQEQISEILAGIPEGSSVERRLDILGGAEKRERPAVAAHSSGVARNAGALAFFVGFSEAEAREIMMAALWHDIGKLAIPEEVLTKPGRLDEEEAAVMRLHARAGETLLGEDAPAMMRDVAAFHHERYDGYGYEGLKGEEIPLAARIVNIADVHDALLQAREYKKSMPEEEALAIMTNDAESPGFGRRAFDPFLLRRFVAMRLQDPSLAVSKENRESLEAFAKSNPMEDVPGGWEANGGWLVKPSGHRIRYVRASSGNRRMEEMRGPTGDLQFTARGPSAVAEAPYHAEDAPRM